MIRCLLDSLSDETFAIDEEILSGPLDIELVTWINMLSTIKNSDYKYWQEVYNHGNPDSNYSSLFLDILNMADMQIDKYGNDVGYDKRIEDIKSRYGEYSKPYICSKKIIENLKVKEVGNYEK